LSSRAALPNVIAKPLLGLWQSHRLFVIASPRPKAEADPQGHREPHRRSDGAWRPHRLLLLDISQVARRGGISPPFLTVIAWSAPIVITRKAALQPDVVISPPLCHCEPRRAGCGNPTALSSFHREDPKGTWQSRETQRADSRLNIEKALNGNRVFESNEKARQLKKAIDLLDKPCSIVVNVSRRLA